ncbi:hypothetical protein DC345_12040 [Paenibacillus taichungensis]|uniref:Uncharacterized protein n=1 Tax=Paenibacillus taichungensis TaxID=484184 RepID=A0A329QW20_9BACL|nr:hypothetical protein [Paenibacillus taichungensis]RAW16196.1 hypothetical protein DC345_12040 [Paenibacillus taichungensis]
MLLRQTAKENSLGLFSLLCGASLENCLSDAINVPKRELPNSIVRVAAIFNPKLRMIATLLGKDMSTSNQKAQRILGWTPRSAEEAIIATGKSMMKVIKGQMK